MGQQGFWDVEDRQQKLEPKKSLLNQLNQLVPWESFRPILMQIHAKPRKSQAGRKPTDVLFIKCQAFSVTRQLDRRIRQLTCESAATAASLPIHEGMND